MSQTQNKGLDIDGFDGLNELLLDAERFIASADDRLVNVYHNTDKGDAWVLEEARWHLYKAHDELSSATHHSKEGNLEEFMKCVNDAFNHMRMAVYINMNRDEIGQILHEDGYPVPSQ